MIISLNSTPFCGLPPAELGPFSAGDPAVTNGLYISNGDFGGGGGHVDFLNAIFPPSGPPTSVEILGGVIARHGLDSTLRGGRVFYAIRPVAGYKMPRLITLSSLPCPLSSLVACMNDVDSWNQWMPRFSFSRGRSTGREGEQFQEARMKAAGLKIHYQVRVISLPMGSGHQIRWSLDKAGFKKDRLALGLAVNDGSCTFLAAPDGSGETYLAYEIHTQVSPLLPGTVDKITRTTVDEFPDFPTSLGNRALDSHWTRNRPGRMQRPFAMAT